MVVRRPLVLTSTGTTELSGGDVLPDDVQTVSAPAWAASTAYRAGDLVWQASALYRRITTGTSGTSFDPAQWTLIGPSSGAGGGASSAAPSYPPVQVGDWVMMPATQIGTLARPNGELQVGYQLLPEGTYDSVAFHVDSVGSGTGSLKVVVYADTGGRPGATLADAPGITISTGGIKTVTGLSIVAGAGGQGVWAGVVCQGAPSTAPNYWSVTRVGNPTVTQSTAYPALFYANVVPTWMAGNVTAAAPAGSSLTQRNDAHVRLAFRRSA